MAEDTSAVQGNVVGGSGEGQTVLDMFAYTDDVMAYVGYDWSDWSARVRAWYDGIGSRTPRYPPTPEGYRFSIPMGVEELVPPFTAVKTLMVDYMSKHRGSYKALRLHPELVADIARQEKALSGRSFRYIPKSGLADASVSQAVKDGDIIAIVSNKGGLDIAHLGFAVWRADGLHLLNASMIHRKVVEEPMTLGQYLQRHPSHLGIRIVRLMLCPPASRPPSWRNLCRPPALWKRRLL